MKRSYYTILFILSLLLSCNSNKRVIRIISDSMYPAIHSGDYIVLDTNVKTLDYGDIVGYSLKADEYREAYNDVFRIVGLPGDSIAIKDYVCTVNGIRNQHKFLGYKNSKKEYEEILPNSLVIHTSYFDVYKVDGQEYGQDPIKIPDNHYFLLGDCRDLSIDSRYFGTVPKEEILGKVIKIIEGDREEY